MSDWRAAAACHPDRRPEHIPPHEWTAQFYDPHATPGRPPHPDTRTPPFAQALAICAECPVRDACLMEAMSEEDDRHKRHGVRGGLTPEGRSRLRWRLCPCGERFTLPPRGEGAIVKYCSDECRRRARNAQQQAWMDRRREAAADAAHDRTTVCDRCGWVDDSGGRGLGPHRRLAHGIKGTKVA